MQQSRIAVIGGGIAGLMASARLAHAGARVTLFEASDQLGGKIDQARFATPEASAGPTAVDKGPTVFSLKPLFEEMFASMGLDFDGYVTAHKHPVIARHFWSAGRSKTVQLDLLDDMEANIDAISAFAGPKDAKAFRHLRHDVRHLFATLDHAYMRADSPNLLRLLPRLKLLGLPLLFDAKPWRSLRTELMKRFRDPRLVQLFSRYATYCGGMPDATSGLFRLVIDAELSGVWRLDGGMAALAKAFACILDGFGVDVQLNSRVMGIETEGGSPKAVTLTTGEGQAVDGVLFAGDVSHLTALLPPDVRRKVARPRRADERSLSANTLAGVGRVTGVETAAHTVFFSDDYDAEWWDIKNGLEPSDPTLYLHRDQGRDHDGLFFIENARALQSDTPPSPDHEKETAWHRNSLDRINRKLGSMGASMALVAPPSQMAPVDFARRYPGSGGAIYGPSPHGMLAPLMRQGACSQIKGLYLAGGSVHPSAGVPLAALSGFTAAGAVIKDWALTHRRLPAVTFGGMSMSYPKTGRGD